MSDWTNSENFEDWPYFPRFDYRIVEGDRHPLVMECRTRYRVCLKGKWVTLIGVERFNLDERSDEEINFKINRFLDRIYKESLFLDEDLVERIENYDEFQGDEREFYLKFNPHLI